MKTAVLLVLIGVAATIAVPLPADGVHAHVEQFSSPEGSQASAESSARSARGAISKSSSEVDPNGGVHSSSVAAKTDDHNAMAGPYGTVRGPVDEPVSGPAVDGHAPEVPAPVEGQRPEVPAPVEGPVPTGPAPKPKPGHNVGGGHNIQKVNAAANMQTGTAVATASNKRSVSVQKVNAEGNKAISKAQNSSPSSGGNFQQVGARGGALAVATASNSGTEMTGPSVRSINKQQVTAEGHKAIASAEEKKGSDKNLQIATAHGTDLAVAKATSSGVPEQATPVQVRSAPEGQGPAPIPPKSVQVVSAQGGKAISKAEIASSGVVNSIQKADSKGTDLAVATASKV